MGSVLFVQENSLWVWCTWILSCFYNWAWQLVLISKFTPLKRGVYFHGNCCIITTSVWCTDVYDFKVFVILKPPLFAVHEDVHRSEAHGEPTAHLCRGRRCLPVHGVVQHRPGNVVNTWFHQVFICLLLHSGSKKVWLNFFDNFGVLLNRFFKDQ